MTDDLLRPWRDALAMVQARIRGDSDAWTELFMPYVEAFIDGERQPIANLFGAFSQFGARIVQDLAETTGKPADALMEHWLLYSAEHDPDDPNAVGG